MDDWSETTNSPITHRSSARRSSPRAPAPGGAQRRATTGPALAPAPAGSDPPPQKACHASPLDDIHTPGEPNKLSGKVITGPVVNRDQRPLTGPDPGATRPRRHSTPIFRADPRSTPALLRRGDAPTGPHPHSATSSPQPAPAAHRAPAIGTARHPIGTPRHHSPAARDRATAPHTPRRAPLPGTMTCANTVCQTTIGYSFNTCGVRTLN